METIRILGISGSPRLNRNTSLLVKEALSAAEKVAGVETEFIDLAHHKIEHCRHCDACISPLINGKGSFECVNKKDDMPEIYTAVKAADGVIFGSPVYISGMSSILKAVFDRMRPFAFGGTCCWKVGGAIAVGMAETGGGLDTCLQDIHNSLRMLEFISVSGLGNGGAGISGPPYGPAVWTKDEFRKAVGVERHVWGKYSSRMVGRRVAEVSKIAKLGKAEFGDNFAEEFLHGYHSLALNPRLMKKLLY